MGFSCRTKTAVASCSYYFNCRFFREKGEDSKYVCILQKNRRTVSVSFLFFLHLVHLAIQETGCYNFLSLVLGTRGTTEHPTMHRTSLLQQGIIWPTKLEMLRLRKYILWGSGERAGEVKSCLLPTLMT